MRMLGHRVEVVIKELGKFRGFLGIKEILFGGVVKVKDISVFVLRSNKLQDLGVEEKGVSGELGIRNLFFLSQL